MVAGYDNQGLNDLSISKKTEGHTIVGNARNPA